MNENEILDTCLDALRNGASLASCMEKYPALSDESLMILQAAASLHTAGQRLTPDSAFKRRARGNLMQRIAADQARTAVPVAAPGLSQRLTERWQAFWAGLSGPNMRFQPLAAALAVIIFLALGLGVVSAAQNAQPGDLLYPIKQITEQIGPSQPSKEQTPPLENTATATPTSTPTVTPSATPTMTITAQPDAPLPTIPPTQPPATPIPTQIPATPTSLPLPTATLIPPTPTMVPTMPPPPTASPMPNPTTAPTMIPTKMPTMPPTKIPTMAPTHQPPSPTIPAATPTIHPTATMRPTQQPPTSTPAPPAPTVAPPTATMPPPPATIAPPAPPSWP